MFKGIHNINLDAKGRLTIPTKYRNTISDQSNGNMVVTIDSEEKCLLLYPATVFSNIEKKINDLPSFTKNHRRIQRLIIGHAEDLELDSSGRILLSKPLRIVATILRGLDKSILPLESNSKSSACPIIKRCILLWFLVKLGKSLIFFSILEKTVAGYRSKHFSSESIVTTILPFD